ncbi:MAG TPA: Stp1/IreP family PP2C-type Ser/Thr phosphatase [Vicinamibacterales bacterium]|nr:Stp1/IreP family PP2C-type Ser/Thr phosphatase [Vicinamibacterales bacterium]
MRLRVGARTDTGRVRPQNEDAYMSRAEDGLFVVCDGMGGAPAGEVASEMAIQSIARQLTDDHRNGSAAESSPFMPHTTRLLDAVRQSNEFIYGQAQKDPRQAGMGTTVVGAWIREQIAGVAHVGDSRAYLWHDDRLEPLTRDHSLIEAHVEAGLIDEGRQLPIEQQNVLVRVLGREPAVDVDVTEVPLQSGDYVLLCSDGLTRMVPEAEVAKAIRTFQEPQQICDHLIAAANENGGADNITVVVVEVTGGWWRRLIDEVGGHVKKTLRPHSAVRRGHDVETNAPV